MDKIRQYYGIRHDIVQAPPKPKPLLQEAGNNVFNPILHQRFSGRYPFREYQKNVVLDLEEFPNTVFQHAPTYAYFPEHSNIDVNLG